MNTTNQCRIIMIGIFLVTISSACQSAEVTVESINITQAYQTVEARLTEAVGRTAVVSLTTTADLPTPEGKTVEAITETETQETLNNLETPSTTPIAAPVCYKAAAAYPFIDITIEDDTEMVPGQEFTKIWRVVNVGTCAWSGGFSVEFFSGEQLAITNTINIATEVAPNQTIDLEVEMVAPTVPGTYQSNWKLRNSLGELFGIGPNGNSAFWVRIIVVEVETETPAPTITVTPTPVPYAFGSVTLAISDTLDLDTAQINFPDSDLDYQNTNEEPPQHQIVPLGGALFSVFGTSQPSLEQCQNAELNAGSIVVEQITIGSYICYRTSLGLPGWARLDAILPDDFSMTLEILTWTMP